MGSYLSRVIVIPTSVFLSVLFGASYGSGREVVEFVSSNGPTGGLVALITLVLTHAVLLVLSFELARMFKSYDYVSFFKVLLKKGWFLYEIVILIGLVIALSITTSVGGTVLEDHFGMSAWIGSLIILAVIVVLNYFGRKMVESSMMLSVTALFVVLAVLIVQLVNGYSEQVTAAFSTFDYQEGGVYKGLMYAIGGGGYIPLLLYCATGLKTRSEAFTAGIIAALVAGVPALIFHFAFMAGYPEVIEQRIPTYWMFDQISTPLMLNIYVAVMFVLITQTGVGVLQGFIERLDVWHRQSKGVPLTSVGHAGIAAAAVVFSTALGSMGIIALILRGYTILFVSFIVVFVVPLLTYGLYLIIRRRTPSSQDSLAGSE